MFYNSINNDYGLVVRIDNVSHVIDYSKDGIFISAGTHTYLAVNREFKTSLPKPYSNCDDLSTNSFSSDLYNLISNSKYVYSQKFCLQQCLQDLLIQKCNCSASFFTSIRNGLFCSSNNQTICILLGYYGTYLQNNYVENVCLPQCPLECNSSKVTYSSSSNQIVPSIYGSVLRKIPKLSSDFINRSLDDENTILKSIVKLNVFYDSLAYTISTESPQWDIVSLVASIGGNLGLFLGVCMFSLGEMVITLIEIILIKYSINKKVSNLKA